MPRQQLGLVRVTVNISLPYTYHTAIWKKRLSLPKCCREDAYSGRQGLAQTHLGLTCCRGNRARERADPLASLARMYDGTRLVPGQVFTATYLGEAYWRAGELDDEILRWVHAPPPRRGKNPKQVRQRLTAQQFERHLDARNIKAENELALAYAGYGRLHKWQGWTAEANDYLTRALEIFERLRHLIESDKVRPRGRWAETLRLKFNQDQHSSSS